MVRHHVAGLASAVGVGVVSFLLLHAWSEAVFDGRAQSVLVPLLVVSLSALGVAALLGQRLQGRWWPAPLVVAFAWFAQWQYVLWSSLLVHG